jgi:biopolymer transport protein ExbD
MKLVLHRRSLGDREAWVVNLGLAVQCAAILMLCLLMKTGPLTREPAAPGLAGGARAASLTVALAPDGGLSVAGQVLTLAEWDRRLTTEMARHGGRPEDVNVVLNVDQRSQARVINQFVSRLKRAGITQVQIALPPPPSG